MNATLQEFVNWKVKHMGMTECEAAREYAEMGYPLKLASGQWEVLPKGYKARLCHFTNGILCNGDNPDTIFYVVEFSNGKFIEMRKDNLFYARWEVTGEVRADWLTFILNNNPGLKVE